MIADHVLAPPSAIRSQKAGNVHIIRFATHEDVKKARPMTMLSISHL
jgi:hypothetical protein